MLEFNCRNVFSWFSIASADYEAHSTSL